MIKRAEKKKIVSVLGKQYTGVIQEYLNKLQITNSKAEPYSKPSISLIVCGAVENIAVENAIIDLVVEQKEIAKQLQEERKNKLK